MVSSGQIPVSNTRVFPSFPSLVDTQIKFGSHMHITPWCYPQLYLYFKLAGFSPPVLIEEPLSKPKHFHERLLGFPSKLYIQRKIRKSKSDEEKTFGLPQVQRVVDLGAI